MKTLDLKTLSEDQKNALFQLWNNEYSTNVALHKLSDLDTYLDSLTDISHTLLISEEGEIMGWSSQFWREERKWFVMLVNSSVQGKGHGKMLVNRMKEVNAEIFGWVVDHNRYWKVNGEHYLSPLNFYCNVGFNVIQLERFENDHFSAVLIHWKAS